MKQIENSIYISVNLFWVWVAKRLMMLSGAKLGASLYCLLQHGAGSHLPNVLFVCPKKIFWNVLYPLPLISEKTKNPLGLPICSIWCHYVMEYLILKLLYYPYSNLASMLNALTVCQNTTNKDGWNPLIKYMTTLPATSWKHTARWKLSSEWKIMFVASPNLKEDISLNWKLVLIIYR